MFRYLIHSHSAVTGSRTKTFFVHIGSIRELGPDGTQIAIVEVDKLGSFESFVSSRTKGKIARARVVSAPGLEDSIRPGQDIVIFLIDPDSKGSCIMV